MEGLPVNSSSANSPHNSRLSAKRNSSAAIAATETVKGNNFINKDVSNVLNINFSTNL